MPEVGKHNIPPLVEHMLHIDNICEIVLTLVLNSNIIKQDFL